MNLVCTWSPSKTSDLLGPAAALAGLNSICIIIPKTLLHEKPPAASC